MRKTLALLLAVAFLYLVPSAPPSIKSQTLVAASKFYTVANPIPNRYIVVLATTDLSPIAGSGPNTKSNNSNERSGFSDFRVLFRFEFDAPCCNANTCRSAGGCNSDGPDVHLRWHFLSHLGRSAQGLSPARYPGGGDSDERGLAGRVHCRGWRHRSGDAGRGADSHDP